MLLILSLTVSDAYYYIWIVVGLLTIFEKCMKGLRDTKRGNDE